MVERLTPSSRAMEAIVAAGWVSGARAGPTCSGVIAGGRLSFWPRVRAAARPSAREHWRGGKGTDPAAWPADLRRRGFPPAAAGAP